MADGIMTLSKVKVEFQWFQEMFTMANGWTVLKMGKDSTILVMEIIILVLSIKEWGMAKGDTDGKMRVAMRVSGFKIKCMDSGYM